MQFSKFPYIIIYYPLLWFLKEKRGWKKDCLSAGISNGVTALHFMWSWKISRLMLICDGEHYVTDSSNTPSRLKKQPRIAASAIRVGAPSASGENRSQSRKLILSRLWWPEAGVGGDGHWMIHSALSIIFLVKSISRKFSWKLISRKIWLYE